MNVNAPLSRIKVKRLQGTLSAENFELVNPFISSVVAGVRKTFRVLVRQDRTISLHGGKTGEVLQMTRSDVSTGIKKVLHYLRRDELKPSELSPCLFVYDVLDFGVGLCQGLVQDFVLRHVREFDCTLRAEITAYEVRCGRGGHRSANEK